MLVPKRKSAMVCRSVTKTIVMPPRMPMVPDGVVHALRAREDDKGFVRLDSRLAFAPGDKVRVLAGAFIDSAGLFSGVADHDRVSILLDMLGRKVRVLLDADMVAAA